jgi:peptide-methionine (S)-S-oxide reductase
VRWGAPPAFRFWKPEARFAALPGVTSTRVGYCGGGSPQGGGDGGEDGGDDRGDDRLSAPVTYDTVCNGDGNTEVVRVTFDPSITSYEQVLGAFWEVSGSRAATRRQKAQYKSAIFFSSEEQRGAAVASLAARAAELKDGEDLVTEVLPMGPWRGGMLPRATLNLTSSSQTRRS